MPFAKLNRLPLALLRSRWPRSPTAAQKRPPAVATAGARRGRASAAAGRTTHAAPPSRVERRARRAPIDGDGASGEDLPGGALAGEGGPLADVHFDYDQAALTDEARATLERHALWLQGQRDVARDGRGPLRRARHRRVQPGAGRAAGARRARLPGEPGRGRRRLRTVSYGKERPLDTGSDEAAWARNRRAHFGVSR